MPKDTLKTLKMIFYTAKKRVAIYDTSKNRHARHTTTAATTGNRIGENLTDRIAKFQDQQKDDYVYKIPLKFLWDLGLVDQCFKFHT